MNTSDFMKSIGSVGAEFVAKLALVMDGCNVVPPSQYVAEHEHQWMPSEKALDVFYEVMPSIAELSIAERVQVLRGLVFALLTPLEMMDFSDGFTLESARFLLFLKDNPQFKYKFSSDEEKEKVARNLAKTQAERQARKFERDAEIKKLGNCFADENNDDDE
jgi:hypothetical protein